MEKHETLPSLLDKEGLRLFDEDGSEGESLLRAENGTAPDEQHGTPKLGELLAPCDRATQGGAAGAAKRASERRSGELEASGLREHDNSTPCFTWGRRCVRRAQKGTGEAGETRS